MRRTWRTSFAADRFKDDEGKEVAMLRIIMAVLFICCGLFQVPATAQQPYPTRPIRLIVPYSAGGASDVMARYFGERLGALLKQPVIIIVLAAGLNACCSRGTAEATCSLSWRSERRCHALRRVHD